MWIFPKPGAKRKCIACRAKEEEAGRATGSFLGFFLPKYFLPSLFTLFSFYFVLFNNVFTENTFFILINSSINFFLHGSCFSVVSKPHCQVEGHINFFPVSLRNFLLLHFTFRSVLYFELIFVRCKVCV